MPTIVKKIISYVEEECTKAEIARHINEVRLFIDNDNNIYEIDVYIIDIHGNGFSERIFVLEIDKEKYLLFKDCEEKLMEYVKDNIPDDITITVRG